MRIVFSGLIMLMALTPLAAQHTTAELLEQVKAELALQRGFFALAYIDLQTKEQLMWNEKETFHAASTMKTPVMIEVYKQVHQGRLLLTDSILLKNEFKSIVDGSAYALDPREDSDQELYKKTGSRVALSQLVYEMIIMSSNLATNTIMQLVQATNVTASMRELGAKDIQVLRGVEDQKAFDQQRNNTTTAYDLALLYGLMAEGQIIDRPSCDAMIGILLDQQHNTLIPALLPAGVKVAHKTGTITGLHHDSGIVFLPDGRKYVLVILSRQLENVDAATASMARVSRMVYQYFLNHTKNTQQ